jgi:integrase
MTRRRRSSPTAGTVRELSDGTWQAVSERSGRRVLESEEEAWQWLDDREDRRTFGTTRQLPSGRWQARYTTPAGERITAPTTFASRQDADGWLATRHADMVRGTWLPDRAKATTRTTLRAYADAWLDARQVKPRTRAEYRRLLDAVILPELGDAPLSALTPAKVRAWYASLDAKRPTQRARAYGLLSTVCATAVTDDVLASNPCRIRGAGHVDRATRIRPASLDELAVIVEAMPARLRLLVLLASWCALRFGEATELRRRDVELRRELVDDEEQLVEGTLRIRRGVVHVRGESIVGTPKTAAGARDVAIPPHLLPVVVAHLDELTAPGRESLLFAGVGGAHLAPSQLYASWYPARHLAGRDDLRFHDLRHTGAVLAAQSGATLAELMARLGHTTPQMAMRYQHAAAERDRELAAKLSELATRTNGREA